MKGKAREKEVAVRVGGAVRAITLVTCNVAPEHAMKAYVGVEL